MKGSHDTISVEMKVFILIAYVESKFASKGRNLCFICPPKTTEVEHFVVIHLEH